MHRGPLTIEVIPTPGKDYRGKPYTIPSFRFWDHTGIQHEGCTQLNDVLKAMGINVKPGDLIKITVEIH